MGGGRRPLSVIPAAAPTVIPPPLTVIPAAAPTVIPPPLTVIPATSSPSFPAPTVIPAKAGIHTPAYRYAGTYRGSGFRPAPE